MQPGEDANKQPKWGTCPAPQVTLTDTDADNYVLNSSVVTITATFSAAMSPTATISIGSVINSVAMTVVSSSTFRYVWDVDAGGSLPDAVYSATVSGVDTNGRAYIGTDSITFTSALSTFNTFCQVQIYRQAQIKVLVIRIT